MKENNNPLKKEQINAAALALFSRTHNVKKVSIEDIAAEAGVSPTTIYNTFGTREKLIFEVIKVITLKNLEKNRQLVNSALPFPQKLMAIIGGKRDLMDKLDAEIVEKIATQDASMRPFIDELYEKELTPLWKKMMQDGQKEGYIDEKLDMEALMIYLDIVKAGLSARPELMKKFAENPTLIINITRLMFYGFMKNNVRLF
jgi:TetR/AcrR family transcriptional regulator, cholesterol catabolism regulator